MIERIKDLQEKQRKLCVMIEEQQQRINALETSVNLYGYFSVASYTTLRDIDFLDVRLAEKIDRRCFDISEEQCVCVVEREDDSNLYHLDILFQAFDELFYT